MKSFWEDMDNIILNEKIDQELLNTVQPTEGTKT